MGIQKKVTNLVFNLYLPILTSGLAWQRPTRQMVQACEREGIPRSSSLQAYPA
jgi:hypothetical protein